MRFSLLEQLKCSQTSQRVRSLIERSAPGVKLFSDRCRKNAALTQSRYNKSWNLHRDRIGDCYLLPALSLCVSLSLLVGYCIANCFSSH